MVFNIKDGVRKFWKTIQENYVYFIQQYKIDGKNLPNRITELRLLFSFLIGLLLCFSFDNEFFKWVTFIIFTIVAATDKLDGYLARKLNKVTDFGKMLDPIVDKILMIMVLIPVFFIYVDFRFLITIIIVCEMTVSIVNSIKKNSVEWLGKIRMVTQCVALSLLLLPIDNLYVFKKILIIIAAIMNVISLSSYISRVLQKIR